ncbi:MAG: dephospho-CoA kinase [Oligoflexia bacterium]|nr:dephospho-CoA kinase [Oligoflexia bacterium]
MKIIGLTGGIASGKSTVSKMLRDEGQVVIDADKLAREVVEPRSFGLKCISETFGEEVLNGKSFASGGALNRSALREIVFSDERSRQTLERITHPLIQWRARCEFQFHERSGCKLLFYDAALIYEKDLVSHFSEVMVVHTTSDIQLKRLMSRDKIKAEEALKRVATQWPLEKKMELADILIDNNFSVEETRKQVVSLLNK